MLSLQMESGDYVTINDNIVVQVFRGSGPKFRVSIKAPKEVPIVRGAVLEREGEQRPDGLLKNRPKSMSDKIHSAKYLDRVALRQAQAKERAAAAEEMGRILDGMAPSADREALKAQLARIAENEAQPQN